MDLSNGKARQRNMQLTCGSILSVTISPYGIAVCFLSNTELACLKNAAFQNAILTVTAGHNP